MRRLPSWLWLCTVAPLTLGACVVGPKYQKPVLEPPPAYKEWKAAEPGDDTLRGAWWQLFGDPQLSALEDQVNTSNQNIANAMANFLAARSLVKQARAQYFPQAAVAPQGGGVSDFSEANAANAVAEWMFSKSLATGHGDTVKDMLNEAEWQIAEAMRAKYDGLEAALKSRRIQTPNDEYEQGWNRGLEVAALLLAQDT